MPATVPIWAVSLAVALHNLEEALWLPVWSQAKAGRRLRDVAPATFRFAVLVLTSVVIVFAALAQWGGPGSTGHYLLAAYALGQSINVLIPHLLAAVVTRSYAPGLVTGVVCVWPASAVLMISGFSAGVLLPSRFAVTCLVVVPGMLVSIPVLFRIGRRLGYE